ncbi:tRNA lysidine(34) synthetase TilS [Candidatus Pelagibacter sp.]|nr:tRNA lysidine(34) synthetase TilS [Candidatus Pelagibacter sp.]
MTAKNKVNNKILSHLKDKELSKIYKNFDKFLKDREINSFTVSLSGGPDSLALAYFSKCFQLINNKKVYYVHIDHKIRKNSTKEAKDLKYFIKKYQINCEVFSWKKNKKIRTTQKNARIARYSLLEKFCKKKKINALLLAHHKDDLYENFFIRMLRGSGIRGLTSFSSKDTYINKNLKGYRPFLDVTKETLLKVTNKVFGYFIDDPSNYNDEFLRIRIRNLLNNLKHEGFNKEKFDLTYCNLHSANETLKYYSDQNILENTNFFVNDKKNTTVINFKFFKQPNEIVLRSLSSLISKTNRKYYPPRGKIMLKKINEIRGNSFKKTTVGGCIIERVYNTTLIYPENTK